MYVRKHGHGEELDETEQMETEMQETISCDEGEVLQTHLAIFPSKDELNEL